MKRNKFLTISIIALMLMATFGFLACEDPNKNTDDKPGDKPTDKPTAEEVAKPLRGKLLILQVYAPSETNATAASHAFVELYNNTDSEIDLTDFYLWFAEGRRKNDADFNETTDKAWSTFGLSGTIPAKSSFLILGKRSAAYNGTESNPKSALQLTNGSGDINLEKWTLNNRSVKVVLVYGKKQISVQNLL